MTWTRREDQRDDVKNIFCENLESVSAEVSTETNQYNLAVARILILSHDSGLG